MNKDVPNDPNDSEDRENKPAFASTDSFSPADLIEGVTVHVIGEEAGTLIRNYRLIEKVGEGSFGIVWRSEQLQPVKRQVALKIIKAGMDTAQVVARFEAERQALALMDHPNIAVVFDAGATEHGRPYFVMEFVDGLPLTQFCDENQLNLEQRLSLFCKVCEAIQHAHQKGVIHRDLKPSNILVAGSLEEPKVKVIDFGIAKATDQTLTDKTLFTFNEQLLGTPAYMSPEQAGLDAQDIDTRADVYSLGVILYELTTGSLPFSNKLLLDAGREEMKRIIREEKPAKPSTRIASLSSGESQRIASNRGSEEGQFRATVTEDIDWVLLKSLEKERSRRYDTVNAFRADCLNLLKNHPVAARPPEKLYLLRKFVARNRATVVWACALVAILIAATVFSAALAVRAFKAEEQAKQAQNETKKEAQNAQHSEAVAKARYYLAEGLVNKAWPEAERAFSLGGGKMEDGFLLDEISSISKTNWELTEVLSLDAIPLQAEIATIGGKEFILILTGNTFLTLKRETSEVIGRTSCPDGSFFREFFYKEGSDPFVTIHSSKGLETRRLPEGSLIKNLELDRRPFDISISGQKNRLAVLAFDENIHIYSLPEFSQITEIEPIAPRNPDWKPRNIACSEYGDLIAVSGARWNSGTYLWNIKEKAFESINNMRSGFLKFTPKDELLTWWSEAFGSDDSRDWLGVYSNENKTLSWDKITSKDLKGRIRTSTFPTHQFRDSPSSNWDIGLYGSQGFATINTAEEIIRTIRYDSLSPTKTIVPTFLGHSSDGNQLLLNREYDIEIYKGHAAGIGPFSDHRASRLSDFCAAVCDNGVFATQIAPTKITFIPFGGGEIESLPTDWKKTGWYPWAVDASPDASTLALILVESLKGSNTVSAVFGKTLFVLLQKSSDTLEWELALETILDVPSYPKGQIWQERFLYYDLDSSLITYWYQGAAKIFDATTGQMNNEYQTGSLIEFSPDGKLAAKFNEKTKAIEVVDSLNGEVQKSIALGSRLKALCFSQNQETLFASNGQKLFRFDLDSGEILSEINSHFLPFAYSEKNNRMVVFEYPKGQEANGNLLLVDGESLNSLFLMSNSANIRNTNSRMSRDENHLVVIDRWSANIFRKQSPEALKRLHSEKKGPRIITQFEDNPTPRSELPLFSAIDTQTLLGELGNEVIVRGKVQKASRNRGYGILFLNYTPDRSGFSAISYEPFWRALDLKFGIPAEEALEGREVEIVGEISTYAGKPQIVISDPDQITLLPKSKEQ